MAYATAGLSCAVSVAENPAIWTYTSADALGTVIAADYFSDGDERGMKLGDVVFIYDSNTNDGGVAFVTLVTAGGAASAAEYQAITT